MRHFLPRLTVAATVAVVASLAGPMTGSASAHGDEAEIEVQAAHPVTGAVHYIVDVVHEDDGHPAEDATVTATAIDPDGQTGDQIELTPGGTPGTYDGTLEMDAPGEWTVRFASLNPEGSLTHTEVIEGAESDEAGADDETEAGAEAAEPEVFQSNEDAEITVEEAAEEDDDSDGPSIALLALVFLILAAVVALVFWLVMKNRSRGEAGATGTADDPAAGGAGDDRTDRGSDADSPSEGADTSGGGSETAMVDASGGDGGGAGDAGGGE